MTEIERMNRKIILHSRPVGAPTAENFRLEKVSVPAVPAGHLLLRNRYLSLDPYMRGRMSEGASYASPVTLGDVMVGGTIASVEFSQHPDFKPGELVIAYGGWQDYLISDGAGLTKVPSEISPPSLALGVLGMTGFTAYVGLLDIGLPKPGETVVVAAATGAVGAVVGQIAKLKGCRVIAIAGGTDKCRYAVEELGFDACIDHHLPDLNRRLESACSSGIDVYFENVGGAVFDAVLPLLNVHARVPLCGLVALYNDVPGKNSSGGSALVRILLTKRIRMQGFIIGDSYAERHAAFFEDMMPWVKQGKIKYREDVVEGLERAPDAFIGMLKGKNFGKLIVKMDGT
ncbi:MAG: NADP-dependent oxidoreductase [Micavibrio sp.]|nr:NADP-dependent oxidoreductase [Micavibrio sp.]